MAKFSITYFLLTLGIVLSAPVPENIQDNLIEQKNDGLLLLVPTLKVDEAGKPTKREIEYELIAIPGEVLRREVRQIAKSFNAAPSTNTQVVGTKEGEEFVIGSPQPVQGTQAGETFVIGGAQAHSNNNQVFPQSHGVPLPQSSAKPALPLLPAKPELDVSKALASFGTVAGQVLGSGATLASGAQDALQTASQFGQTAAVGGAQAVKWVLEQKASGLNTATQVVSGGLQYAGQLSTALLRTLLQVPGIKARVLAEIVEASQPLATAVSDVIYDSADDLGDILEAKTEILRDALGIVIRLVQDTLALNGRIIASFGAGGLDKGASLFNAGIRIGGALVDTAGSVASAVGRGVGDIVQVASQSNIPPPPALPPLTLPTFPEIKLPTLSKPSGGSSVSSGSTQSHPVAPALSYGVTKK